MNIKLWLCKHLGWHSVKKGIEYYKDDDPLKFQAFGLCNICGKEVMQDSQGNWF